jgi:predicted nucleotidyltransferase
MGIRETLKQASTALTEAGIDHALIGGMALGCLGMHRATADVDLLIDGSKKELAKEALIDNGFRITTETEEVLHFSGAGALDLLLAHRQPTREMLQRAKIFESLAVKCVVAEDIIGLKIQAYINEPKRALQDKADIAGLIQKHKLLDWAKIRYYADLFGEWPTIEKLRDKNDL